MRVVSLGSGSSGNAFFVEAGPQGRTRLLIDAGLSARTLAQRLQTIGVTPAQLQGILVTHEHSDHVQGIPTLVKRWGIDVIADPRTLQAIEEGMRTGAWRTDAGKLTSIKERSEQTISTTLSLAQEAEVEVGDTTSSAVSTASRLPDKALPVGGQRTIGDIEVTSFAISHDAVAPCGFLLSSGACRVCIITDSGEVTPGMLEAMSKADLIILEANHDREQLLRGPYPWYLKRRILSPTGHLSNEQAAAAIIQTWREDDLRWFWLAHLSRTNNTPGLAIESVRAYLKAARVNLTRMSMSALPPTMGSIWDSTRLWQ